MAAPSFDSAAASASVTAQTGSLAISWSHTPGAVAKNCGVVAVFDGNNGAANAFAPQGTPTASFGAKSLTFLGTQQIYDGANYYGFITVWAGLGVPTGSAQTISTSMTDAGQAQGTASGMSFVYNNVGSFGALQTATGNTAAPQVAVPSAAGHLVWGMLGNWYADALSGFTLTARESNTITYNTFTSGDGAGALSVTVGAAQAAARGWGAVGFDMFPAVAVDVENRPLNVAARRAGLY